MPREQWPTRRVREHMVPLGDQVQVPPDAWMDGVLGKLQDGEAGAGAGGQGWRGGGIVTPSDLPAVAAPEVGAREQTALSRQLRSRRGLGWESG